MNTNTLILVFLAILIGLVVGLLLADGVGPQSRSSWDDRLSYRNAGHMPMYGPGFGTGHMPMHGLGFADGQSGYENDYPVSGMGYGMMGPMHAMAVESEQEFLELMIPHHEEAVATAREVLERGGTTEEIRTLLTSIVDTQTAEIADMKAWYETWYGEPYQPTGEYVPMMRELDDLSGETLDRVFLADMIGHHMGAIMMAHSVQPYLEHEALAELTDSIVRTQSAEIRQMQQMLRTMSQ